MSYVWYSLGDHAPPSCAINCDYLEDSPLQKNKTRKTWYKLHRGWPKSADLIKSAVVLELHCWPLPPSAELELYHLTLSSITWHWAPRPDSELHQPTFSSISCHWTPSAAAFIIAWFNQLQLNKLVSKIAKVSPYDEKD